MGDGICQDYNNGPLCDYDLGDCCLSLDKLIYDECCDCICHLDYDYPSINTPIVG